MWRSQQIVNQAGVRGGGQPQYGRTGGPSTPSPIIRCPCPAEPSISCHHRQIPPQPCPALPYCCLPAAGKGSGPLSRQPTNRHDYSFPASPLCCPHILHECFYTSIAQCGTPGGGRFIKSWHLDRTPTKKKSLFSYPQMNTSHWNGVIIVLKMQSCTLGHWVNYHKRE